MYPRNVLTITMISLKLLTLFTGTNGQPLLQYLSVHSRFHTGYYDHFHSCHACIGHLVWKNEGKSVGGYSNSNGTRKVFTNHETTGTDTIVNSSILLTSNTYNNSLCLSSLLIITSINGSLSSDVSCNSWNTYENIIKHSDISQKRSENGSIVIDYIFAEFIETAAYSLAYHGVMCKTVEPSQLWLVNNHTIHVHASDDTYYYHFVMNEVKCVIVLLNKTSAEFISFISLSYMPPKYPLITVACIAGDEAASVTLLNTSSLFDINDVTSSVSTSTGGPSLSIPVAPIQRFTNPSNTDLNSNGIKPKQSTNHTAIIVAAIIVFTTLLVIVIVSSILCYIKLKNRCHVAAKTIHVPVPGDLEMKDIADSQGLEDTNGMTEHEGVAEQNISEFDQLLEEKPKWDLEEYSKTSRGIITKNTKLRSHSCGTTELKKIERQHMLSI